MSAINNPIPPIVNNSENNDYLKLSADSDVTFEKIISIKPLDKQQVYDLNTEGTHNFIANDIVVHNTGSDGNNPPTSDGIYPNISVNTSGLVGLWYFNNESAYGEATLEAGLNNKTVDFSVYANSERALQQHMELDCCGLVVKSEK